MPEFFFPRRALSFALLLCLASPLSPASADDGPIRKLLPDLTGIKKEFSTDIEKLKQDLTRDAARLKEKLIGAPKRDYPAERRTYAETQRFDFERDIRPILDRKCIACHACFDAPCQLKLEAGQGLERGASKVRVYDGTRLSDIPPTRLHIDGHGIEDWRRRGFFPVLGSHGHQKTSTAGSLLKQMLALGRSNPLPANQTVGDKVDLGIARANACPAPGEFATYAATNPRGGMPLAVAGLSDEEYATLSTWLDEGAKVERRDVALTADEQAMIARGEAWFNRTDNRVRLVARYLYEHLFMGHLYFRTPEPGERPTFFQLIRSSTPPGTPAIPVDAERPNDLAEEPFFYRLIPITDTIVHKTHVTYRFDDQRLADYDELFLAPEWSVGLLPEYGEAERANPFITFAPIPAMSRYRFLLSEAEFFIRNVIRGPVCNGQIATAVIRDQFWVMFEDPAVERYVNDAAYRDAVSPHMKVPGLNSALSDLGSEWLDYQKHRSAYASKRRQAYQSHFPKGAKLSHVWNGDGVNTNTFLSVFRHHDSASVLRGWHGELPLTAWLMDYPLFERTFYELVVGFNVFGGVSHQAQTRLSFDLIRNESETNFLRLLPASSRRAVYNQWYQASGRLKTLIVYPELDTRSPTSISFETERPKNELLNRTLMRFPAITGAEDPINRCGAACPADTGVTVTERLNNAFTRLAARPSRRVPGILWLPEVTFLRVDLPDGDYRAFSLLRNRRHSNVAFILGESWRFQEELDSLTILPTLVGSYPNLMLRVDLSDINRFAETLTAVTSEDAFDAFIRRWAVLRMSPEFWDVFHDFSNFVREQTPLEAGIYDINRYGRW